MIKEELQGSEPGEETILEAENLLRNQFSRKMMSLFNPGKEKVAKMRNMAGKLVGVGLMPVCPYMYLNY